MKTSEQWWEETKSDSEKLVNWLKRQYHGEVTAAERIEKYCIEKSPEQWIRVLRGIAFDERKHAEWVGVLLSVRGISAEKLQKEERYWDKTLGQIDSFQKATAVAAHAENMRLERIRVIAGDESAPQDIRGVFQAILFDEERHAAAFKRMAGDEALAATLEAHIMGSQAIGLINVSEVL